MESRQTCSKTPFLPLRNNTSQQKQIYFGIQVYRRDMSSIPPLFPGCGRSYKVLHNQPYPQLHASPLVCISPSQATLILKTREILSFVSLYIKAVDLALCKYGKYMANKHPKWGTGNDYQQHFVSPGSPVQTAPPLWIIHQTVRQADSLLSLGAWVHRTVCYSDFL